MDPRHPPARRYRLRLAAPAPYTASPFFSAAPLVAAPLFPLRQTIITAVLALTAVCLLQLHGVRDPTQAATEIATVVTVAVLALLINRVVRRSGERLASRAGHRGDRAAGGAADARRADRRAAVAARYEAAQADAFIGGDLFAVQETPYGVRLVRRGRPGQGDGRGRGRRRRHRGLPGGGRAGADRWRGWRSGWSGRCAREGAPGGHRRDGLDAFEGFTTAVLAEIPHGRRQRLRRFVRFVNRGHPPPAAAVRGRAPGHAGAGASRRCRSAWVIWRRGRTGPRSRPYPPGATLLLYTDGLSEARDAEGVFYDPAERLRGRIFPGPEELLDALVDDVRLHTGGRSTDDMALLAVSRPAAGQPERRRTMPVVPPGGPGEPRASPAGDRIAAGSVTPPGARSPAVVARCRCA